MAYRKRIKTTRSKQISIYDWNCPNHQIPYISNPKREDVNPFTGKYNGWVGAPAKDKGLKKKIRRGGKFLINEALLAMEEEQHCEWCGSDFCENPLSCADEAFLLYEQDRIWYETEQQLEREEMERYEQEWLKAEEDNYFDYAHDYEWEYSY